MKLEIENLHAEVDGKEILKGVTLTVKSGEVHAVMGPNGAGKSTLSNVIMGHPRYRVTSGDVKLDGASILGMSPDKRARAGIFMSFQYPVEVPGVSMASFLRSAHGAINGKEMPVLDFQKLVKEKTKMLGISDDFIKRGLNEGFSGGEKKKGEILQLAVLSPKLAILDETDSGLDVDALRTVAEGINKIADASDVGVILITHYNRILKYVKPDFVHIMSGGRTVKSGKSELALLIEEKGYSSPEVA
ncbi:MAG: Fe-S cluster assembly ATPase SufC [Candidatus Aenigmarchaeota archaeon]|nr:Fe-S cluster assembly ATPase SufC [Candidatus Aenigmarchaeota archaeon]